MTLQECKKRRTRLDNLIKKVENKLILKNGCWDNTIKKSRFDFEGGEIAMSESAMEHITK